LLGYKCDNIQVHREVFGQYMPQQTNFAVNRPMKEQLVMPCSYHDTIIMKLY